MSLSKGQTITPQEVIDRVYSLKRPTTSIMEVRLEVIRKKGDKEKTKTREFTRYEKFYDSGKYRSKSLARFMMPKMVKGTGLFILFSQCISTSDQVSSFTPPCNICLYLTYPPSISSPMSPDIVTTI